MVSGTRNELPLTHQDSIRPANASPPPKSEAFAGRKPGKSGLSGLVVSGTGPLEGPSWYREPVQVGREGARGRGIGNFSHRGFRNRRAWFREPRDVVTGTRREKLVSEYKTLGPL